MSEKISLDSSDLKNMLIEYLLMISILPFMLFGKL